MSLTGKLILGFLFALVLQVAQMLISGYVSASVRETTKAVSGALQANITVQRSLDVAHQLQADVTAGIEAPNLLTGDSYEVFEVFANELALQAQQLQDTAGDREPLLVAQVVEAATHLREHLGRLRDAIKSSDRQQQLDALAFVDDDLIDARDSLQRAQVAIGKIGQRGVEQERLMRDLPWQAGITITLCGVVIMAAFVAWFSRQLVIPIERAWAELELRVTERTTELASTVDALENEITERQRAEQQKEELNRQLVDASRQAGMAELANGVLHNVGNVLNSVNVSTNLLLDKLAQSRVEGLSKAVQLLRNHDHELAYFLQETRQGQQVPEYLDQLAQHLATERDGLIDEAKGLGMNVEHMKEIVRRQQTYASASATTTRVRLRELIDDVLQIHRSSLERRNIQVTTRIEQDEECEIDRSRVMQIIVNLIKNAAQAIEAVREQGGLIEIAVERKDANSLEIVVTDNGLGIDEDDLARIFAHGFTTKDDGHGFGLHHSANSASEMSGSLRAASDGPGCGATFRLRLPVRHLQEAHR